MFQGLTRGRDLSEYQDASIYGWGPIRTHTLRTHLVPTEGPAEVRLVYDFLVVRYLLGDC